LKKELKFSRRLADKRDMMRQIDWNAMEAKAGEMNLAELHGAINDILKVLPHADAMDRETGSGHGGYYRDESSVYRTEIRRRMDGGKCRTCGR
jgi:hypothetical protein